MRNVKIVFMSFLVMMLAGSAWAAGPTDHVKIAPNNQGDVLFYPFYAAIDGGFETKLEVVNTSATESTVAKLVVRSQKYSQELLDFLIFLSPSDVWTGTLKWDAEEGTPVMYSEDDSVLAAPDTFADADNPVNRPLIEAEGEDDTNMMGYVYVINAATRDEGSTDKVDKSDIKEWYLDELDRDLEVDDTTYSPANVLAGFMDFNVDDAFLTSGLNAVTLRDYDNEKKLTVGEETVLGEDANNSLFEVEAILSKEDASIPYVNTDEDVSLHFFTFPTKYDDPDEEQNPEGPYFVNTADEDYCVPFSFNAYNLQEDTVTDPSPIFSPFKGEEESKFCQELNWVVSVDFPFEEGFTRYSILNYPTKGSTIGGTELEYTGAPFIPMQMNLGDSGLSMKYAAWTDGEVSQTIEGESVPMKDYHYSDVETVY